MRNPILGITAQGVKAVTPTVEYLVIAGGGCAGPDFNFNMGGGGAGGYRTGTGLAVTAGSAISVTVGAGGGYAANGNDSVFSSITSIGGGKGASVAKTPTR